MHSLKSSTPPRNQCTTSSPLRRPSDSGLGVCDLDTQSLSLGDNLDSLSRGYGVGDLGGVGSVVHEEEVDVSGVVDEEGFVA